MQIVNARLDYRTPWKFPVVQLFTGNDTRRRDGAIVMGRGAAREVRDRWPAVQYGFHGDLPVRFESIATDQVIGWFQVKRHWGDQADPALIKRSAEYLAWIVQQPLNQRLEWHMNYPGIGNGRLTRDVVEPLLQVLPDNVYLYLPGIAQKGGDADKAPWDA